MNRAEFMRQLESLLQSIPVTEREEALQYYNDYFDDAGNENEQKVIEALGNPARVAENIKRDLLESGYGGMPPKKASAADRQIIEYGRAETQSQQVMPQNVSLPSECPQPAPARQPEANGVKGRPGQSGRPGESGKSAWLILLIILVVFASPLWGSLLGVVLGVIGTWFGIILGFGLAAAVCFIVAVVLLVVGIQSIFVDPLSGVGVLGISMLVGGVGILFLMATTAMAGIVTPAIFRGVLRLFRKRSKKN